MTEERYKMLLHEKLKFKKVGGAPKLTKEEQIKNLKSLLDCMVWSGDLTQEEYDDFYKQEVKKIEEKNTTL